MAFSYYDTPSDTLAKTKLDVLGQTVLQEIQKFSGFENAVVAGGYIRDQLHGVKFKDMDVFVPHMEQSLQTSYLINNLPENFKFVKCEETKNNLRYKHAAKLHTLIDLTYLETVPIQIVISKIKMSEKFELDLLKSFDFGINQVCSKGRDLFYTSEFMDDYTYHHATLVTKMFSITELPKHMKKFYNIQEKYPNIQFNAKHLHTGTPEKTDAVKFGKKNFIPTDLSPQSLQEIWSTYTLPPVSLNANQGNNVG